MGKSNRVLSSYLPLEASAELRSGSAFQVTVSYGGVPQARDQAGAQPQLVVERLAGVGIVQRCQLLCVALCGFRACQFLLEPAPMASDFRSNLM